jgi:hypothetical protein
METSTDDITPAAYTVAGAVRYSGLTRSYLYLHRNRLDWLKAGRRTLITRKSLDELLSSLPRMNPKTLT